MRHGYTYGRTRRLRSTAMMAVEMWLSCINLSVLYGFHQSLFWHISGTTTYPDERDSADPVWFSLCVCGACGPCSAHLFRLLYSLDPAATHVQWSSWSR